MRRALVLVVVLAACGSSGRTLHPPGPGQTLSVLTTTIPPSTSSTAEPALSLVLPFADGAALDPRFTCKATNGAGVSPGISWAGVPSGTKELVLVVLDPDAANFVHWVLAGIDPNAVTEIPEGTVPAGLHQTLNGFGRLGFVAPCPPSGVHHYRFTLYALPQASGITDGMTAADAITLLNGKSTASVSVSVTATFGA
jgi:Raf kinase inhibitor-like YbhB/YbcL family protein